MSYERQEMKRAPTHPGAVVRLELEELEMTVTEAAERLGVTRPALSALVNEKKSVSPQMALRLGRFFGNGTELWMNMQTRHDRYRIEHDRAALRAAERVTPVHAIP
ncbi:MAG: HigA family addiction module antitoxin [Longimicrobiales bacterium]|nr:HigA family addiction module antitoxin [Longimicrobiales bacterium]